MWHLHISYVNPQYHVVFDDKFKTVFNDGKSSEELDKIGAKLFVSSRECFAEDKYNENGILMYKLPPLNEVWLSVPEWCKQCKFLEEQLNHTAQQWVVES